MTSKIVNRLTLGASLAVFLAAVYVLHRSLAQVGLADVLARLEALPPLRVAAALALTAASYLVLVGYDYLALHYVQRSLRFRWVAFTSFIAFAFSHNVGLALVSGGSVRYRIYSGLGLGVVEIAEVVVFCAVTYSLGITTVGGLMLTAAPGDVAPILGIPQHVVRSSGAALLVVGLAYLVAAAVWRRPLRLGRFALRMPSFGSGLIQVALASVDLSLAGGVVYVLMPPDAGVTYRTFLGIYVLASAAAILSHVPGGLGVFETVIVVMLPDVPKDASLGALVAFRVIYFLLPLGFAMLSMAGHEVRRGQRAFGWLVPRRRATHLEREKQVEPP